MLIKTSSLRQLLKREDMTSEDILKFIWERDEHIFSIIPQEHFKRCYWGDLTKISYAVISYQWRSKWHTIAEFLLHSINRVTEEYIWIDVLCVNQRDPNRMKTVRRSDEIYHNAASYHLIEIGSLFRGWVLFELSSVRDSLIPPRIHITLKDPAMVDMAKQFLRSTGFNGCKFTAESDREIVEKKIVDSYGSVDNFNLRIVAIVDRIFV